MAVGFFALALRSLAPWQAILCAVAAIAHNLWLFPHYGMKKLERPKEKERGYSGMIGYPAVVLFLLLMGSVAAANWTDVINSNHFYNNYVNLLMLSMAVTAGAWAIMAFGDAFAAIGGILIKGPVLPWNTEKRYSGSISFLIAGTLFSTVWMSFVAVGPSDITKEVLLFFLPVCFLATFVAGVIESLPGQLDDNLTVPISAWMVLSFLYLHYPSYGYTREFYTQGPASSCLAQAMLLIVLNFALAGIALFFGWVDRNGFIIGSLVGLSVLFGMAWRGYVLLVLFYVISHFSTYYGKKKKERLGIAEKQGGKRLAGSVFSKGFVPAIVVWLSPVAFVLVLAIYAADTVATEFGKARAGKTFTLPFFKRVEAGTPGGLSIAGSLSGIFSILVFTMFFWWLGYSTPLAQLDYTPGPIFLNSLEAHLKIAFVPMILIAIALLWFFAESIVNSWNSRHQFFSKPVIHVMIGIAATITLQLIPGIIFIITDCNLWLHSLFMRLN